MARPKAGTEAGDRATERWRKTMLKEHGGKDGFLRMLQTNGAKGGRLGCTGGFYGDPERARLCGSKGGKKSRRNKATESKIELAKDEILDRYLVKGETQKNIGESFGVSGGTIGHYIRKWVKEDREEDGRDS